MPPRTSEVPLELPTSLVKKANTILAERGTDLNAFARLQLKRLVKNGKFYGLRDRFNFGKYRDEFVEIVVRGDPEYVAWCLREVVGFGLDPEALDLLSQMGVDL